MSLKQELEQLKEEIKAKQEGKLKGILETLILSGAVEIGVYGSFARGDYKATSDVDVYALYEQVPDKIQKGELYEIAYEKGVDLLVCERARFYEATSIFVQNVLKDRKILWKRGEVGEK